MPVEFDFGKDNCHNLSYEDYAATAASIVLAADGLYPNLVRELIEEVKVTYDEQNLGPIPYLSMRTREEVKEKLRTKFTELGLGMAFKIIKERESE